MRFALVWVRFVLFAVLALLAAAAHAASPDAWIAVHTRGTVVSLVGSEWKECVRGDVLSEGQTVRTLHSGRLVMQRGEERISLGANTAIQLGRKAEGGATTIRQYSGSVVVQVSAGRPRPFAVETPALAVSTTSGIVAVAFDGDTASVSVSDGTVSIFDRVHGHEAVLANGQNATSSAAGFTVGGAGVLPVILDAAGHVVRTAAADANGALPDHPDSGTGSNNGNSGNNGNSANDSDNGNTGAENKKTEDKEEG